MHKELYLTSKSQKEKLDLWDYELSKIKSHFPYHFSWETAGLLVLDMQNYFIEEDSHAFIPTARSIISNIQTLIDCFTQKKRPVFCTQHFSSEENSNLLGNWWHNSLDKDSDAFQLTSLLNFPPNVSIIKKKFYSAFHKTSLESRLNELKVENLVITGVMTHLCCDTTTRDGFMRGYPSFFIIDGTATYTEQLHFGTLCAIHHGFAKCISTEHFIKTNL